MSEQQQQYETVWSGATWRNILPEDPRHVSHPRPAHTPTRIEPRLLAAIDDEVWLSWREWLRLAMVSDCGDAHIAVKAIMARGVVERRKGGNKRGRPAFVYRKVQA